MESDKDVKEIKKIIYDISMENKLNYLITIDLIESSELTRQQKRKLLESYIK